MIREALELWALVAVVVACGLGLFVLGVWLGVDSERRRHE